MDKQNWPQQVLMTLIQKQGTQTVMMTWTTNNEDNQKREAHQ
jgi:hypothetical protein